MHLHARTAAGTVAAAAACLIAAAAPAAAGPAQAALVTDEIALTVEDGTGEATGSLELVNLTDAAAEATFAMEGGPAGCAVEPAKAALPASRQTGVDLTLTGCGLDDGEARVVAVVAAGQHWTVRAVADKPPTPDWDRMRWFGVAALASAVLLACVYLLWDGGQKKRRPNTPLPGLGEDYDFAKSWASNATIVAGAFAAVFGASDVLKAIIGKEDDAIVGLLAVSAAVAVGLVAAGPLVIAAAKSRGHVTPAGLLLGALLTLTATGGQLGVLVETAGTLDLDWVDELAVGLGIAGAALLAVYAWRSLRASLDEGVRPPKKAAVVSAPRKTRAEAVELVAAGRSQDELIAELYPETDDAYVLLTSVGDEPRRRSAVL